MEYTLIFNLLIFHQKESVSTVFIEKGGWKAVSVDNH